MAWERSLRERAFEFSVTLLNLYPKLAAPNPAFRHMALQLFRAGSSIGAQLEEGEVRKSRRDMGAKHAIALREAREARYWLRMYLAVNVFTKELAPVAQEANEFVAMLTVSVRKLRSKRDDEGEEESD